MSASLTAFAIVCTLLVVIAVGATVVAIVRDGYRAVPAAKIRRPLGD